MKLATVSSIAGLQEVLNPSTHVVVEGYNAVGKSIIIEKLLELRNYRIYRPDYNVWSSLLPREYRWAIFSSFFDILSTTNSKTDTTILFDRGIFSGIVYNNDMKLADEYQNFVKEASVVHILITCSKEDYEKFLLVRSCEKELSYEDYLEYTSRYKEAFERAGATWVEYVNQYEEKISQRYSDVCAGCTHYTLFNNTCNNPKARNVITDVSPNRKRCQYSNSMEVQDSGLSEMLSK